MSQINTHLTVHGMVSVLEKTDGQSGLVSLVGAPGPRGPAGTGGGSGSEAYYRHDQATPASTWTINHNLGLRPAIQLFSTGGREALAEVIHASDNQALVYFDDPFSGYAICT